MGNKIFITIFTPTYNRGYIIQNLYESLLKQTVQDFEWLVIDDGSTDNTEDLINKFKNEKKINIRYYYQKNSGKYKAINKALDLANGELFMIVDSDDFLTYDSIETVQKYYNQIKNDDTFFGVVGLRGNKNKEVYTGYINDNTKKNKYYQKEYIDTDYIKYRYKYKISGDRAEVCITEKFKKYKFPENNNEKFMNEGYIWNKIANDGYKFRYFNKVIYITEYLDDGLTKNMKEVKKKSPKNAILEFNQNMSLKKLPLRVKFKSCIQYYRYSNFLNIPLKESFKLANNKLLSLLAICIATIYTIK